MNKFRFHLLGLVHLPTSIEYSSCAFTQKNLKLAKMLTSLGHEVYFYGCNPENKADGVEEYCNSENLHFIETHLPKDIAEAFGDGDNRFEIGYNWHETDFRHDFSTEKKQVTKNYYRKVIDYINSIKKGDDFLLNTMGLYFKDIADSVNLYLHCESGIGYRGSYPGHFRAFESSFIRDFTYGSENPYKDMNGSYYDRIIPNYFDENQFSYKEEKQDYFLYIGRMIKRKGILVAAKACEEVNVKLIISGQGASVKSNGHLIPNNNPDFDLAPSTWEYVGFSSPEKRKELMANAKATFVPTEYQEIFGGVHIESMLSGTPVITTDYGVFTNTVKNGYNGYKCHTLDDFVWSIKNISNIKLDNVYKSGMRYSMNNVKWEFQKWFEDLHNVYESTVSSEKGWHRVRETDPIWRKEIY